MFPAAVEKLRLSQGGGVTKRQNLLSFILAQFTWYHSGAYFKHHHLLCKISCF